VTKDEAIKAVERIADLAKYFGGPNEPALREGQVICRDLRHGAAPYEYITSRTASIEGWAEIGFSTRKFDKYGGPERVRSSVYADCSVLKSLISAHWPVD